MKKILPLIFSILILPLSINASDIYYCSDDDVVGFKPAENYKVANFKVKRFKIMIDFTNKKVVSEDLFLGYVWDKKCWQYKDLLNCMSNAGVSFGIDKSNLRYVRSVIYQDKVHKDSLYIGHGTCEKF